MDFEALNKKILPPDAQAEKAAWAHWDGIAKPLRGLGRLEEAIVRIAALTGSEEVELGRPIFWYLPPTTAWWRRA